MAGHVTKVESDESVDPVTRFHLTDREYLVTAAS